MAGKTPAEKQLSEASVKVSLFDSASAELISDLASIHRDAFGSISQYGWDEAAIRNLLKDDVCALVLAKAGGRHVGFALFRQILDEAELLTLAVDRVMQRAGIAKNILIFMQLHLIKHSASKLFLEVRSDNLAAIALYEACHFEQIAVRRNYYKTADGDRVDAWVYGRDLG